MRVVRCKIDGVGSGLLMHRFPLVAIEAIEKKTPEEQAEIAAYREPSTGKDKGALFVPAVNVQRSLVNAATFSKGKGRSSLQKPVAACVIIGPEERLSLGTSVYEVDSRPVVVPATKGRVIRHRPLIKVWALTFEIEYDERLLTETQIRRIVDDAGSRVGLLDFRPEKKGPFGRFHVTLWEPLVEKSKDEEGEAPDLDAEPDEVEDAGIASA